jgi:type II secretory pathway pseudopilin PulG
MKRSSQTGFSAVEAVIVIAMILVATAVAVPSVRAHLAAARVLSAGRQFRSEFVRTRFAAIHSGVNYAIRFETCDSGPCYSIYKDGDYDGVLSDDIKAGRDVRTAGPFGLTGKATSVRVGINEGIPEIPPDRGTLSGDPIRFGRSRMISFSPLGTATPGTFYLAGDKIQGAVRVTGTSPRVRLLIWQGQWEEHR